MIKILIADDSEDNRDFLQRVLASKHPEYELLFVADGKTALDSMRASQPDLVLLDILMPEMGGYEVLEAAKNDPGIGDIPILLTTAINDTDAKVKAFKLKASDYIVKPFAGEEVLARVEVHLRLKKDKDRLKSMNETILRTQAAFIENSKMAAIGNLAAGVAHEFNNILFIMQGYAEMYSESSSVEDMHKLGKVFSELVGRSKLIVDGLMAYTRRTSGMQEISPAMLLKESLALMSEQFEKHGITLKTELEDNVQIRCNPDQLSQVFLNIIINAVEAMQNSPRRELEICANRCGNGAEDKCRSVPLSRCRNNGKCLMISFKDSGPGIPPEIRERLFNPFLTTKGIIGGGNETAPGKGLGLFISYGIVKNHGGHLLAESGKGSGATFSVILPAD